MTKFSNLGRIIFILLLSGKSLYAQDVITLRNGDQIEARVTEISPTELRFKRFDNLDGPTRVISLSDVFAINYENGTREVINPLVPATQEQPTTPASQATAIPAQQEQRQTAAANSMQTARSEQNVRGEMAFGGNVLLGISENYVDAGVGAKFLFDATTAFRMAAELGILWGSTDAIGISGMRCIDVGVYGHFLIPSNIGFVYPTVGIGFMNLSLRVSGTDPRISENELVFTLGFGTEFVFTSNPRIAMNIEPRVKLFATGGYRMHFATGIAYKF